MQEVFIVQQPARDNTPSEYLLQANDTETLEIAKIGFLALGAVVFTEEEVQDNPNKKWSEHFIYTKNILYGRIHGMFASRILAALDDIEPLINDRIMFMLNRQYDGGKSQDILDEYNALLTISESTIVDIEGRQVYLDDDGHLELSLLGTSDQIDFADHCKEDKRQIQNLGLNESHFQYATADRVIDDNPIQYAITRHHVVDPKYTHVTHGIVTEDQVFIPILTSLDKAHPALARPTP